MRAGPGIAVTLAGARRLTLVLVALALAAAALVGTLPHGGGALVRWSLLLLLPMAVGALATLFEPPPRSPRYPAAVPMPMPRHLPLVLALLACDLAGVALVLGLGWAAAAPGDPLLARWWPLTVFVGVPAVIGAMTLGWEWGLRQRLYGALAAIGRPRGGALLSIVAGTVLALPVVAPGFTAPPLETVLLLSAMAALREATALRLFRRAGILLSGAYRGAAAALDALLIADTATLWLPALTFEPTAEGARWLRAAGPLAALVLARLWTSHLDRRDRERRLRP
jgi:hypothetical protein